MLTLSKERVRDLLTGAMEGGSNYWYEFPNIDPVLEKTPHMVRQPFVDRVIEAVYNHGISLIVTDVENDEVLGEFNLDAIERGETIMAAKYPHDFNDAFDETDDADTADIWFQCCVMGGVVYG